MDYVYQQILSSFSKDQITYLKSLCNEYYDIAFGEHYVDKTQNVEILDMLFLPIWYCNKNKKLAIASQARYSTLTGTTADTEINSILSWFKYVNTPNKILLLCVKRGNSFIESYMKEHTEWKYLDRISLYLQLSAHHKVKVYQNDTQIFICTNLESPEFLRRFMSALPLLLNNTFEFTDKVINIYRSLQIDESGVETAKELTNFIKETKIIETQKLNTLSKALTNLTNAEYEQLLADAQSIKNQLTDYEAAVVRYYTKLREIQAKITFFKPNIDSTEVAQYIMSNPNVVDYATCKNALILAIEAPLEYIDIPAFKKLISNAASFIWPKWSNVPDSIAAHSTEFIQMLSDLFLKDKYTIYTRSEIILDFERREAYPFRKLDRHRTGSSRDEIQKAYPTNWDIENRLREEKTITPHMHIEFYDCWSGNKANITKCLQNNDVIGAIDIAVNTTKDINVMDSTVFNKFLQAGLWAPRTPESSTYKYKTRPDLQFKTIYDNEQKRFRTFGDIFYNDYVKENITQYDINEDLSDII